jgi:hypothetical protein
MAAEPQFATLEELISAVVERALPLAVAALKPVLAQQIEGALSLVDQRYAQVSQAMNGFSEQHTRAVQELKAAIPRMPDMTPIENCGAMLQQAAHALATRDTSGGITELTRAIGALVKSQEQICARLDRPSVREGTAQLPSGGEVKLRVVESKVRN